MASIFDELDHTRERTLALVEGVSDDDLERVHSPLMSPLVWDLGHIAAFEDLWLVHRFGEEPMLREDLGTVYDAFETPRAVRGEIEKLDRAGALDYLERVRERARAISARRGLQDGTIHEMVLQHELQHTETMLQTLGLARLEYHEPPGLRDAPAGGAPGRTGLEAVTVPGGPCVLGAPALSERFSYDNERPRHHTDVREFQIGIVPITNATYLHFVEGGGYERREWWTDEAWAWKEEQDISRPGGWTEDGREWRLGRCLPLDPDAPVVHVSWFEADAFCRAHGVRLPTEAEWEKAATWDQAQGIARDWPWGSEAPNGRHANLGVTGYGTHPAGAYPAGAAPCGALGMLGDVWEWTTTTFDGYPGFRPHPYPEYSEVFFGERYRVLRGGSWASSGRVATPTFRNWDYPQRRQIFSGLRIAKEA